MTSFKGLLSTSHRIYRKRSLILKPIKFLTKKTGFTHGNNENQDHKSLFLYNKWVLKWSHHMKFDTFISQEIWSQQNRIKGLHFALNFTGIYFSYKTLRHFKHAQPIYNNNAYILYKTISACHRKSRSFMSVFTALIPKQVFPQSLFQTLFIPIHFVNLPCTSVR